MKKLIPAYILSFVACFMIYIYEPLNMYSTNINDFWFDFKTFIIPLLIIFLIFFVAMSLFYSLIYVISYKVFKKINIYNVFLVVSYIAFFATYIQGNYLIKKLPGLDGTKIIWSKYNGENISTIVVWTLLIIGTILCIKKFRIKNVINTSKYISLAILVMLSVSLLTTMTSHNAFKNKRIVISTTKNINDASTDKNFFIFMLDADDSRIFYQELQKSEYKDIFDDFTYYPDTISAYPFTRDSIPFIFSGIWNENKTDFITYYNKAFDNSKILKELDKRKYDINIYETEYKWTSKKSKIVKNAKFGFKKISIKDFMKQETKYGLYKYLPYFLKKYSKSETITFAGGKVSSNIELFDCRNKAYYDMISKKKIVKKDNKIFSFIHLEGGHVPFDLDKDVNIIKDGTYEQKIQANIKITNKYLERLKENDVYDNSVIIVMADHGYSFKGYYGRQNPILFIKGIDEHHEMYTSDKPISYTDLNDAYLGLLNGKSGKEIFEDIPDERERRYLWYIFTKEDHMVEYIQKGKAWDLDTLKKTGKEYNR